VTVDQSLSIDLPDAAATARLAENLAGRARPGDVIGLQGPLGSGKTSFARGFIRARGGAEEVPSPTFTLVEIYTPPSGPPIWHFDLYRLDRPEDAYELGIEEAFAEGISLIEWPERLGALIPEEHLALELAPGPVESARRAWLRPSPGWAARLEGLADG
jgi:tRNA threonylcarbamoyladenosine biosynthesis protein TsaE